MAKPTITLTPKKKGPIQLVPKTPSIEITPVSHVPFNDVPFTAMNQNTNSPILFRDLTA